MAEIERYIKPTTIGPVYEIKFPEEEQAFFFPCYLAKDIKWHFNEEDTDKSYFQKECCKMSIPIQYCEFRDMVDKFNDRVIVLGSDKIGEMPNVFVNIAFMPNDNECRRHIFEYKKKLEEEGETEQENVTESTA